MALPNEPVTLSVAQLRQLHETLSDLRHDVNNSLSLMVAALELIRRRPDNTAHIWATMEEQPRKITDAVTRFSSTIEAMVGITRS